MGVCVGLDVHGKESVFVAQDGEGRMVCEGKVPTSPEGFVPGVNYIRASTTITLEHPPRGGKGDGVPLPDPDPCCAVRCSRFL